MESYKHLLFATDLSPYSKKIISRVKFLVKAFHAKLTIVHVMELTPMAYGNDFALPVDSSGYEQLLKKEVELQLSKLVKELNIPARECHLRVGSVKHNVADLAKKIGADLIVLGVHSRHGIEKLVGSSTNAILNIAPCDVLVIKLQ